VFGNRTLVAQDIITVLLFGISVLIQKDNVQGGRDLPLCLAAAKRHLRDACSMSAHAPEGRARVRVDNDRIRSTQRPETGSTVSHFVSVILFYVRYRKPRLRL
jgi:hypothetical protein